VPTVIRTVVLIQSDKASYDHIKHKVLVYFVHNILGIFKVCLLFSCITVFNIRISICLHPISLPVSTFYQLSKYWKQLNKEVKLGRRFLHV